MKLLNDETKNILPTSALNVRKILVFAFIYREQFFILASCFPDQALLLRLRLNCDWNLWAYVLKRTFSCKIYTAEFKKGG